MKLKFTPWVGTEQDGHDSRNRYIVNSKSVAAMEYVDGAADAVLTITLKGNGGTKIWRANTVRDSSRLRRVLNAWAKIEKEGNKA